MVYASFNEVLGSGRPLKKARAHVTLAKWWPSSSCRTQPKPQRGLDLKQNELFSYTTLEQRTLNDHPLRELVNSVLSSMDRDFDGLYATLGRASIAPE
jgi:hypothetical protein